MRVVHSLTYCFLACKLHLYVVQCERTKYAYIYPIFLFLILVFIFVPFEWKKSMATTTATTSRTNTRTACVFYCALVYEYFKISNGYEYLPARCSTVFIYAQKMHRGKNERIVKIRYHQRSTMGLTNAYKISSCLLRLHLRSLHFKEIKLFWTRLTWCDVWCVSERTYTNPKKC